MHRNISRRRFLAGAASVGAGTLVVPRVSAGSYRANEQVGVAVVGVSGRSAWFVGLLEMDQAMRGVALCDVDNRRAADAYARFPDLPKYEDFRVMLDEQKDVDGKLNDEEKAAMEKAREEMRKRYQGRRRPRTEKET